MMDAVLEEGVEEIICLKSAQIGFTEMTRNLLGWWVEQEPGPTLLVMPSEQTARDATKERLLPFFKESERLSSHLSSKPYDVKLSSIVCDSMNIYLGWAGSPQALASRPIKNLILDEVDKYARFAGKEASPIALAKERTATYRHRRRILIGSTPTVESGNIWQAWLSAGDRRNYFVPCPHCNHYQRLQFNLDRLKISPEAGADKIAALENKPNLCFYVCEKCKQSIFEKHKNNMVMKGIWLSETQRIENGKVIGDRPKAKRVAFWINAMYSPWRSWGEVMIEFLRSKDDPAKYMNFKNSWLAEIWSENVTSRTVAQIQEKVNTALPDGICPAWTHFLVASADVQKFHNYYSLWAFGADNKSQLIQTGIANNYDDLYAKTMIDWPVENGLPMKPHILAIDSGGTDSKPIETYQFAQRDKRILPVKGSSYRLPGAFKSSNAANAFGVNLYLVDTNSYKDLIDFCFSSGKLKLSAAATDEFIAHMASEHKVRRQTRNGAQMVWEPKSRDIANHFLDTATYAFAARDILQSVFGPIPTEPEILKNRADQMAVRRKPEPQQLQAKPLSNFINIPRKY